MKKSDKGFAVIIALLIVAIMSAAVATAFFISVADLEITSNRIQSSKALRDAERILAEAEMSMEMCLEGNGIERCVSEIEDSVSGYATASVQFPETFFVSAVGQSGNFSAEIQAVYSAQNGSVTMNSWQRILE